MEESLFVNEILCSYQIDFDEKNIIDFIYNSHQIQAKLPQNVTRCLFDLKLNGEPFKLIKGFNVVSHEQSRQLIATFSSILGYLYKFNRKPNHSFIDIIKPKKEDENKQVGTNSCFLDWHVEDAFHNAKADYICLFCVQSNPNAKTLIFHGKDYLKQINDSNSLFTQKYLFKGDNTFDESKSYTKTSYVIEPSHDPEFIYDPSFMEIPNDDLLIKEINELQNFIDNNHYEITLEKGDLLIFDNRRVAHSRSSYQPSYNEQDRTLLRTLIIESTWKIKNQCIESNLIVD